MIGDDPMKDKWFVDIIEHGTEKVEKSMECRSETDADRVDGGVNINLNHEKFYTRIRREPPTS